MQGVGSNLLFFEVRGCGKDHGTRYAEMCKEHLAKVLVYDLVFGIAHGKSRIFQRKPHHFGAERLCTHQRHKRWRCGGKLDICVLCETIAVSRGAGSGVGKTACADDHALKRFFLSVVGNTAHRGLIFIV